MPTRGSLFSQNGNFWPPDKGLRCSGSRPKTDKKRKSYKTLEEMGHENRAMLRREPLIVNTTKDV
jgi:hypothetical protein